MLICRNGSNRLFAIALVAGLCLAAMGILNTALAQNAAPSTTDETAAPEEQKPQVKTLPPAYEPQLLRLAEVLGALHYLRELCGANEGQTWRKEMEVLLEVEVPTEGRKAQLIAHFNRGFRGYSEIYRDCTKQAAEAANQFLQQGVRLSAEIPNRFGR